MIFYFLLPKPLSIIMILNLITEAAYLLHLSQFLANRSIYGLARLPSKFGQSSCNIYSNKEDIIQVIYHLLVTTLFFWGSVRMRGLLFARIQGPLSYKVFPSGEWRFLIYLYCFRLLYSIFGLHFLCPSFHNSIPSRSTFLNLLA